MRKGRSGMTFTKPSFNYSGPRAVIAGIFMGVMGGEVFIVQPGFVQGLVGQLHYTDAQAGIIASSEMAGFAAMTIALIYLTRVVNWRHLIAGCIALTIIGQLASLAVTGFAAFCAIRFLVGLGCGGIVSIGFSSLGLTDKPDRNFGLLVAFSGAYGAMVLGLLPWLFAVSGMQGLLQVFAGFALLGLPLVGWLPEHGGGVETTGIDGAAHTLPPRAFLALAAMFAYFLAQGVVWAYLFRFGVAGGVSEADAAYGLTVAQFSGILGALVPSIVGDRFGRPSMLAISISAGALPLVYFLAGPVTSLAYAIAVCVYNFGFNKSHPYLLATMASLDGTGRTVTFAVAAQTLGLAIGPAIGAQLLFGQSFAYLQIFGIVVFAASFGFILLLGRTRPAPVAA